MFIVSRRRAEGNKRAAIPGLAAGEREGRGAAAAIDQSSMFEACGRGRLRLPGKVAIRTPCRLAASSQGRQAEREEEDGNHILPEGVAASEDRHLAFRTR